mgnify:CR=1 FL=1
MKRSFIVLLIFFAFIVVKAQEQVEKSVTTGPQIAVEEKVHNFGTIAQGDVAEHTFEFKNIGTEPLKFYLLEVLVGVLFQNIQKRK